MAEGAGTNCRKKGGQRARQGVGVPVREDAFPSGAVAARSPCRRALRPRQQWLPPWLAKEGAWLC